MSERRANFWPVWLALAVSLVCLGVLAVLLIRRSNRNQLALGPDAAAEVVEVAVQPPAELDFLSRAEVLALRQAEAARHAELLAGEYQPSEAVFGQIEDGLPWWGLAGIFYYGSGERSLAGPSEETRFLLNPYLLVGADLYHHWGGLPENEVLNAGFPLDCPPFRLTWYPSERRAEALYSGGCISQTNSRSFDLIAYNARDFNLGFVYVAYDESLNVSKPDAPTTAYAVPHYLHRGESCEYPGGCNNMSPPSPEIDSLQITGFPAQVVVRLWSDRPGSVDETPEMVFVVRFSGN